MPPRRFTAPTAGRRPVAGSLHLRGIGLARLSEAAARVTALAGGDPVARSCLEVTLPGLAVPPLEPGASGRMRR